MLDVLAPSFQRVVGIDRSQTQLDRAERLCRFRGYENVELLCATMEDRVVRLAIGDGADAVFATRVLHHAPVPRVAMASLVALLRPMGTLVVLDYQAHSDESFREQRADQWLGFSAEELVELALLSGLVDVDVVALPGGYVKGGIDQAQAFWLLSGRRP
jgi:ArsR family transcriptional regulator